MGCFEFLSSKKKDMAKAYVQEAATKKNPYNLEFDEEWVKYLYQGTKMTFHKWFVLLCCILPSFSKAFILGEINLIIEGCDYQNPIDLSLESLPLTECVYFNKGSQNIKVNLLQVSKGNMTLVLYQLLTLSPHILFFIFFYIWRSHNKVIMWLKGAKITPTASIKRWKACAAWTRLILMAILISIAAYESYYVNSGLFCIQRIVKLIYPYKDGYMFIRFEQSNSRLLLSLASTIIAYSCLLITLHGFLKEPMLFFYGFKRYCKHASEIPYNVSAINYRLKIDALTDHFFGLCETNDCYVVLMAYTTYLLDNQLLISEKNKRLEKIKETELAAKLEGEKKKDN